MLDFYDDRNDTLKKKFQYTLTSNMLACLVIHNNFITAI